MTDHIHVADQVLARYHACTTPDQLRINWLLGQGVPAKALSRPEPVVTAEILFDGQRFDFADECEGDAVSESALLFLQFDELSAPTDLVAWQPRRDVLATWLGRVGHLGEGFGPRLGEHGVLHVWPSVIAWLRSGRDGIVLVDAALARRQLCGPFAVIGGEARAREFTRAFTDCIRVLIAEAVHEECE